MTNKEAINLLDNLLGIVEDNQNNDYDTALKMAIEALKQPEIIRRKECKHKRRYKFPPKYDEKDYCSINERVVTSDDFCSWAERRTDETD